jgi:hypothetical protein
LSHCDQVWTFEIIALDFIFLECVRT